MIGAIVLVMAIVVVLPMVLDSEPKPVGQGITVQIPSPDSGTFTSKVVPLQAAPAAKPATKALAESQPAARPPAPEEKIAVPATVAATPKPAAAAPEKEAPKTVAKSEKPKPSAKKAAPKAVPKQQAKSAAKPANAPFVVQVIALADAEKAKQLQERIAAAGIKSYTEVVKTAKGDVTRVRAGPFATRAAAEKAREQLKTMGMNGNITTKSP